MMAHFCAGVAVAAIDALHMMAFVDARDGEKYVSYDSTTGTVCVRKNFLASLFFFNAN